MTAATLERGSDAVTPEIERKIQRLNDNCAHYLDNQLLDEWTELFLEDGRYIVHPRECRDAGLEGYWLYLDSRKMMRDRAVSLKKVNIYDIHYERRFVSNIVVTGYKDSAWLVRANYMIIHTDNEGHSKLYSAGEYADQIVEESGCFSFRERIVIVDTFTVPTLLSTPI